MLFHMPPLTSLCPLPPPRAQVFGVLGAARGLQLERDILGRSATLRAWCVEDGSRCTAPHATHMLTPLGVQFIGF